MVGGQTWIFNNQNNSAKIKHAKVYIQYAFQKMGKLGSSCFKLHTEQFYISYKFTPPAQSKKKGNTTVTIKIIHIFTSRVLIDKP